MRRLFSIPGLFVSSTAAAALLAASISLPLAAQSGDAPAPVPQKRFHQVPGGQFFVPANVPVQLGISLSGPGADTGTAGVGSKDSSVILKEGPNTLQFGETKVPVIADGTPPKTQLDVEEPTQVEVGGVRVLSTNAKLHLMASDALSGVAQTLISMDGAAFVPMTGTGPALPPEGAHHLRYFSVDQVGNAEKVQTYTFRVDGSAPSTKLNVSGNTNGTTLSVEDTLTLTAQDNDAGVQTVFYQLDSKPAQTYAHPIVLLDLSTGAHTLQYFAVDAVGNREAAQKYAFTVDSQPPAISLTISGPQFTDKGVRYISPQSEIALASRDAVAGPLSVRYTIADAKTATPYSAPFKMPAQSGIERLHIESVGPVQNNATLNVSDIYMDLTPPQIDAEFSRPSFVRENATVINPNSKVQLNISDFESGVASVSYSVDGGAPKPYSAPFSVAALGNHTISVTAVDHVGNQATAKEYAIIVEPATAGPAAAATLDAKRWYQHPKLGLIGPPGLPFDLRISTSSDASADSFLFVPAPSSANKEALSFSTSGKKDIRMSVTGKPTDYGLLIDGAAPKTEMTPSGAPHVDSNGVTYFGAGLKLSLASNDDLSGVWKTMYSLDGASFAQYGKPLNSFSREGSYTLRYYALDNVGNAETEHTYKFTVDTSAPQTLMTLDGLHSAGAIAQTTRIQLAATDNLSGVARLQYQLDTDAPKPYTAPLLASALHVGNHKLRYYAVDVIGNREAEHVWNFRVAGPVSPATYEVHGTSVERGGTVYMAPGSQMLLKAPGSTIVYAVDGGTATPYTTPIAAPESGTHKITFRAVDELGSTSTPTTLNFVTDRSAPTSFVHYEGPQIARGEGTTIISGTTRVAIGATGSVFGASTLEYALNNGHWQPYTGPFTIKSSGNFELQYRAQNALSTMQTQGKAHIIVFAHGPNVSVTYSGPTTNAPDAIVLSPGELMFVSVDDISIGLKKITYKLDDGPELYYRTPLSSFSPGKLHTVTIVAEDLLGNRTVKTVHVRMKESAR